MDKGCLYTLLGRCYHIPKNLFPIFLKEMESLKMIKILGTSKNNKVEILPIYIDLEEQIAILYRNVGLF